MQGKISVNEDAFLKLRKRKKILEEGKGYFTGYPSQDMPWLKYYTEEQILSPIPHMTAYDYLRLCNNNNLNNIAIEFLGKKTTYIELFQKINKTAKALIALGVQPGDIITIALPACPEETYLLYAIDLIGACANYMFIGTPLNEIQETAKTLNSNLLIVMDELLQMPNNLINNNEINLITHSIFQVPKTIGSNVITWKNFIEKAKNTELKAYYRSEEEPLFIAKTGGSTGKPKSVVLSDKGFNLQVHQHLNTSQKYEIGDRWLRLWPLFSASAAVSSHHLPLCCGMEMIIEPNFSLDRIDEIVLEHKPSHMPFIASGIDYLINSPKIQKEGLSFMKSLGVGGEAMTEEIEIKSSEFLSKFGVEEHARIGYGMTENSSGAAARFNSETTSFRGSGVPQLNTIISIFEPNTDIEKKYGEEGEICVLSSTYMLGYYNDIDATNSVLRKHSDGQIWLHSGDLGYMNDDGHIFIQGRMKRVISLFDGHKIYPLALESLIETLEEVEKAIIIPEIDPHHPGGVRPCCFIVPSKQISEEELLNKINETCFQGQPEHSKIKTIYYKKQLPKTSIGKIDLHSLEEEAYILSKRNK